MSQFPIPYKLIASIALATLAAILGIAGFVFLNASTTTLPTTAAVTVRCGIENCHGLDFSCGSNVPDACTEQYVLGDRCRSHASCQKQNGSCNLVKDPQFESCVNCVTTCQANFPNDPSAMFECESSCQ